VTQYLDSPTPIACVLYNFHDATLKIKASLLMNIPLLSDF